MDITKDVIAKRLKPNIEIISGILISAAKAGTAPPAKLHNECLVSIIKKQKTKSPVQELFDL